MPLPSPANAIATPSEAARQCASLAIRRWPTAEPLDARIVLERHPELWDHKSVLLDLVYEEYQQRLQAGEPIVLEEFVDRFPQVKRSLLCYISVIQYLESHIQHLSPADPTWPAVGESFLNFTLVAELGRGSFSRVFLARDTSLGNRQVVVKVCQRGSEEAAVLGQLEHANIVPVLSAQLDDDSGLTAICMPFLTRATLLHVLDLLWSENRPPRSAGEIHRAVACANGSSPDERPSQRRNLLAGSFADGVAAIGAQLAEALDFSHRSGVFHCDIKPSNILMTDRGSALLFDFNLSFQEVEQNGNVGGTVPYMAPEHLQFLSPQSDLPTRVDARTDIYSLGVTLYELLTGELPFGPLPHPGDRAALVRHLHERQRAGPRPIRMLYPAVDPVLARTIEGCLSFDPDCRPASGGELAAALRDYFKTTNRVRRWLSAHVYAAAAGTMVAFCATGTLAYGLATREPRVVRLMKGAGVAFQNRQVAETLLLLDSAVKAEPDNANLLFARGRARMAAGELALALEDFRAAGQHVSDGRITACIAHGVSLLEKDYAQALTLYEQAERQGETSAEILNNMGYCYSRTGNLPKARICLERAIELNSGLGVAYFNLAAVELPSATVEGRAPDLEFIEKAVSLGPEHADLFDLQARTYGLAWEKTPKDQTAVRDRLAIQALEACAAAIKYGADPVRFKWLPTSIPALDNEPQFRALMEAGAPSQPRAEFARLVDPLAGQPDLLFLARR